RVGDHLAAPALQLRDPAGDDEPPAPLGPQEPRRSRRAPRMSEHSPLAGRVGIASLIVAEASLFGVFVVAYLFYIGKSLNGPYPKDVLDLPVLAPICLLSSSISVALGARALRAGDVGRSGLWLLVTVLLGGIFLAAHARERTVRVYNV